MKRNKISKLIVGTLVCGLASCTGDYLDINTNPYQPGDLTPDDYALGSAMNNLASAVISSDVNTAQFTDCLLGGTQGGYFADCNASWAQSIANYNATNDWTRVFLKSDWVIPILYSNLTVIQQQSETTENPVPAAIAQVVKVAAMHRVTDTYGPIPYSQIGEEGNITTPYDSQKDVYYKFFEELDEAIATLTENRNAALTASADYVYSGNVQNWIKFANSLKLRLAMRIVKADPDKAQKVAESAVAHEIGVIESNDENAMWNYFGSINNPLFVAINYNAGDSRAAADIVCYMNGYNDNRRASYFTESGWDGETYVGVRRGINKQPVDAYFTQYSTIKISASDPVLWMNASEVAFLRAEGALRGWTMGGTAAGFYEQGVRLSFEYWGATGVDAYLDDDTSVPALYVDPAGLNTYANNISSITIKWNDAGFEESLERIITQKWIANWKLGNEAWADYRRTGYPHLIPATDEGNLSNGVVDSNRGARRMPYPSEEYTSNTQNVQDAVSNLLGGADNMATDVWWAR